VVVVSRPGIKVRIRNDQQSLNDVLDAAMALTAATTAGLGEKEKEKKKKQEQERAATQALVDSIQVGSKFASKYGDGHVLGCRPRQVWFLLQQGDTHAWYWTADELMALLQSGGLTIKDEGTPLTRSISLEPDTRNPDVQREEGVVSRQVFMACLRGGGEDSGESDCDDDDNTDGAPSFDYAALVTLINDISHRANLLPMHVPWSKLCEFRRRAGLLPGVSDAALQTHYTILRVFNRCAEQCLPYADLGVSTLATDHVNGGVATTFTDTHPRPSPCMRDPSRSPSVAAVLCANKCLIFSRVKIEFWNSVVAASTTYTNPPSDDYDRPDEVWEIGLNFPSALHCRTKKASTSFDERLRRSIFGQLHRHLSQLDDAALRRSYVHIQDAGQARAFFVRREGEGVDDHGGPYRAVFQASLGEEVTEQLDIFVPCDNANEELAENRDQCVLNPTFGSVRTNRGEIMRHLGRLMGVAQRHSIQVSLSLPKVFWKPLTAEKLGTSDLKAINHSLVHSLEQMRDRMLGANADVDADADAGGVSTGDAEDALELLVQVGQRVALSHAVVRETLGLGPSPSSHASPTYQCDGPLDPTAVAAFTDLIFHRRLTASAPLLERLKDGLSAVVPAELFPLFSPEELEQLFCGQPQLDTAALRRTTIYDGVSPRDPHIELFWEALEALSATEQSKLVNFCSGRARLPPHTSDYPMFLKLTEPPMGSATDPDRFLPTAQTCFFSLALPQYTDLSVMLQRLRYAINNAALMDADFAVRSASGWDEVTG
jgi:hypothetical protein